MAPYSEYCTIIASCSCFVNPFFAFCEKSFVRGAPTIYNTYATARITGARSFRLRRNKRSCQGRDLPCPALCTACSLALPSVPAKTKRPPNRAEGLVHFAFGEINGRAVGGGLPRRASHCVFSRPPSGPCQNKKTSRMAGLFVLAGAEGLEPTTPSFGD